MISTVEKIVIKDVIGKHYAAAIIAEFELIGLKPVRASVFTKNLINQLINGKYENFVYENVLLDFLERKKIEKKKLDKKRLKLAK